MIGGTAFASTDYLFTSTVAASEPTQVEWVGTTDFALATDADGVGSCGTETGQVRLLDWTGASLAEEAYYTGGSGFRPEGLDVFDVSSSTDADCAGYDYAAYVADYCGNKLYVFGIDSTSSPATLDFLASVSIANDASGSQCKPSKVEVLDGKDKAVVLCQTSSTAIIFNTSGVECSPPASSFESGDHNVLKRYKDSGSGSCSSPYNTKNCGLNECDPHDVA